MVIGYDTLALANAAVENGQTIKVLKNVTDSSTTNIDKNINIDTQTYTLNTTQPITIVNSATLTTLGDGIIQGTITGASPTIKVLEGSTLNVSGPTVIRETVSDAWETIELQGTINLSSGKVESTDSNAICTYNGYDGKITMTGGNIVSNDKPAISLKTGYECKITEGKIEANSNSIKMAGGTLEISGDNTNIVTNSSDNPTLSLNPGSSCKISGGNITGKGTAIKITQSTLEIDGNGTTITSSNDAGFPAISLNTSSTCKITGGNISQTANSYGIEVLTQSTLDLGSDQKELNIENPCITGTYGVYTDTGIWNFYNGILKGTTAAYNNAPNKTREGYGIANSNEDSYQTAYLVENRAPQAPTVTYNTKTTNSITVNANAADEDGDSLTYTMYTSTAPDSGFVANGTATAVAGTPVTLTANNLAMYTTYYYYVTATDGKENATSTTANVRTYCSGTTNTCTPSYCSTGGNKNVTCTTCGGDGGMPCTGSFSWDFEPFECIYCGYFDLQGVNHSYWSYHCDTCDTWAYDDQRCWWCGRMNYGENSERIHKNITCTNCSGKGTIPTTVKCPHNYTYAHYYCPHSNNRGSGAAHYYCAHSTAGVQHD